jgi:hypothetical protein
MGEMRCIQDFGQKTWKGRDYSDLDVKGGGGGDSIRMDLREIGLEGVDWIDLAQDKDQW